MRRIGILQPGYIPWLGFFEQMYKSDIFVYLDDVQYTKNDWRNRNRIKTKDGIQWLTIPIKYKFGLKINEVKINNEIDWSRKHIQAIKTWYGRSKYYGEYILELEDILNSQWENISTLDIVLIEWIAKKIGINCKTVLSSKMEVTIEDKQMRIIKICQDLGSDIFYEGRSGQNYIDTNKFESNGIKIEFQAYEHPYYYQMYTKEQGFVSHLSTIDLLFNHGKESLDILVGNNVIENNGLIRIRHGDEFKKV